MKKTDYPETIAYRTDLNIMRDLKGKKSVECGGCNRPLYDGWKVWIIEPPDIEPAFFCTEKCVNLWREIQSGGIFIQKDGKTYEC